MAHRLSEMGIAFELHYCARAMENIAFADELKKLGAASCFDSIWIVGTQKMD
jgi:ferredoxin-NADP reductase